LNKLIYSSILKQCINHFDANICNENLYGNADKIDIDNAMLWHNIAAIKLKNGDLEGAISALAEANKKVTYDNYFYQSISFIEQRLSENSSLNFKERLTISMGIGASNFTSLSPILNFCEKNYFTELEITDTCYQTALHLVQQSNTTLPRLLALNLQHAYHDFYKNTQELENISNKSKKIISLVTSKDYQKTLMLLPFDEELARSWLALSLNGEETNAVTQLIKDAIIYSKDPNYNPCPQKNRDNLLLS